MYESMLQYKSGQHGPYVSARTRVPYNGGRNDIQAANSHTSDS